MRAFSGGTRRLGAALAILAIVMIAVSLAVGWYQVSTNSSNGSYSYSATTTLYLGSDFQQTSSTSTPYGSSGGSSTLPYTDHYNATGTLYGGVQILVVVALLAAIGTVACLFLGARRGARWDRVALILIVLVFLLVLLIPLLVAANQPSAFGSDVGPRYAGASPSPTNSFYGSCSNSACGPAGSSESITISWGPGAGWILAWPAMVLLFGALYVLWRSQSYGRHFLLQSPRPADRGLARGWRPPPAPQNREAMDTPPALRDLPEPRAPWDESTPQWPKPPE
jgi:hypothetical protein